MNRNNIRKIIALGLFFSLLIMNLFSYGMDVCATQSAGNKELTPEEQQQKEYEELLKKTFEIPIQTNELTDWPKGTGTYGDAAIVMDVGSGAVLYAKNVDKTEYPASITKMLTALLVFEYNAMDLYVEITEECQECLGAGYANIGSDVGDVLTMEEAMHAMLLASANDIAYAIGDTVAKSQGQNYDWFLERMNERVRELGGVNSNFLNTNGVFDENHYTCAFDMALIGRELCKYPDFFSICQTPQYKIEASATTEEHVFQQKHEMLLKSDKDYYEYAIGGKTGYTTEAQNTLITIADNGEKQLVCVVLYTYPGYVYEDTKALFEYGFSHFESVPLEGQFLANVSGFPQNATVMLPEGVGLENIEMEISANKTSGGTTVSYYYEENQVGLYQLSTRYAMEEISVIDVSGNQGENDNLLFESKKVIVAAVVVFFLLIFYLRIKIRQRRRRKLRKEKLRKQREMERRREEAYRQQMMHRDRGRRPRNRR